MDYMFYKHKETLDAGLRKRMNDKIVLELDNSNKAEIYLHGATVTSWISDNKEILFLSSKSVFDNKKAIRGGIPIVFPNFGPWEKGPQHGFARVKKWTVIEPANKVNDSISVKLSLTDDEETRLLWDFKFELIYEVTLTKKSLKTNLTIKNLGSVEFDFTTLLHTYFRVDDISNVRVQNFVGLNYVDKVKGRATETEARKEIQISEEVDRVYASTDNTHLIDTGSSKVTLIKENLPDTVVWNPWIEKAKAMSDFGDEEYKNMICVEAGRVNTRYALKFQEEITMGQTIIVQ
ncbi:unnamed protein product [Brachionus calyciflorus]|uniref:glucose-6-phosphate 1-epimerase n=1 Tax=Brachionus calyciflorus TaxID=104777 RepID=A0A813YYH1_9BILA|nr:unnamed protein product [Brachionus calyciflorus]